MQRAASFLAEYPYLSTSLLALALCLAGMALFPRHRKATLLSALLALPWGLWAIPLVPAYWTPHLVVHVGRVGVEDFLWAFATGGLAWLTAFGSIGAPPVFRGRPAGNLRRYLVVSLVGAAAFVPLWAGGAKVMTAFLVSVAVLGLLLICLRRDLWRPAALGAIGFGLVNALVMKSAVTLWPDYFSQMTPGALCGVRLWGLPVEEWSWAVATGAVWPLTVCYVFDAHKAIGDDVTLVVSCPGGGRS